MVVIFEGPDNVGKGTQIRNIFQELSKSKPTHTLHYSGIKRDFSEDALKDSKKIYKSMFRLLNQNYIQSNFILDRSHLGEYVYGHLYRKYDPSYIFDLEKSIFPGMMSQTYLLMFIDNPMNLIKRDDGLSLSTKKRYKIIELYRFQEAFKLSHIKNKFLIDIEGKDINDVKQEIFNYLDIEGDL